MDLHAENTTKARAALSFWVRTKLLIVRAIASPAVRLWLLRFPATRWFARRESQYLFDVCAGFVYSQILFAFVDTPLLKVLSKGPAYIDELANVSSLPLDRIARLMQATCAIGLTDAIGKNMYCLGLRGAALVKNPGVIAMIRHHALLYQDLSDPISLLRDPSLETRISNFWSYLEDDKRGNMTSDKARQYSELMAASQAMISEIICASVDFRRYPKALDVGGGIGTFAQYIAESAPHTAVTVFDLPEVIAVLDATLDSTEKVAPIATIGGDFFEDQIPKGYDLITLIRVLYDHSDENVIRLLANIRESLGPHGTLLIAEPFASVRTRSRTSDAYFNMYLLAMRAGNVRSFDQHGELLKKAGFRVVKKAHSVNPSLAQIIIARV